MFHLTNQFVSFSLVEGNSTRQPLDIRLGQTVTNINIDDVTERAQVLTSSGDEYSADFVIVTVSLGILKSGLIQFSPSLPEYKQNAINRWGRFDSSRLFYHVNYEAKETLHFLMKKFRLIFFNQKFF